MDELERHLRELADHRADQVPELDPTSLTAPGTVGDDGGRNWRVVLVAAAVVLALLAGGGWLVLRDDGTSDHASVAAPPLSSVTSTPAPTTSPATTAPPPTSTSSPVATPVACPETGNDTNPGSGSGNVTPPPLASLERIQVWSSDCVDSVAFKFGQIPDWSVTYANGPVTLLPSGQPVSVAGGAQLVVTFREANLGQGEPSQISVPPPSGVRELRKTQEFEGVLTWVIGLDSQRGFGVRVRSGEIVIDIDKPADARSMFCPNEEQHYGVTVPAGWYVMTSFFMRPCTQFARVPTSYFAGDPPPPGPTVMLDPRPFAEEAPNFSGAVAAPTLTTVQGRPAKVYEFTITSGLFQGSEYYQWAVDWGSFGTIVVSVIEGSGTPWEVDKAAVEQIARSARLVP
jgi:hypothetical protein